MLRVRRACRLRTCFGQRKVLGRPTGTPTQLRSRWRLRIFSAIRLCEPGPSSRHPIIPGPAAAAAARRGEALCKLGGHDVAEAQPALTLVDGAPLTVHVLVQQTADELRAGGVADEAQYEVVHERGVV